MHKKKIKKKEKKSGRVLYTDSAYADRVIIGSLITSEGGGGGGKINLRPCCGWLSFMFGDCSWCS